MGTETTDNYVSILRYLLTKTDAVQQYMEQVDKYRLFDREPMLYFIWESVRAFYERHRKVTSANTLERILKTRFAEWSNPDINEVRTLSIAKYACTPITDDTEEKFIQDTLQSMLLDKVRNSVVQNLTANHDIEDVLETASRDMQSQTPGRPQIIDVFDNFEEDIAAVTKNPLGVPFIDDMIEGGMSPGEILGFIMPTGTGKTTLGLQISDALVLAKKKVAYFSFEQPLRGDIMLRQAVLASQGIRSEWRAYAAAVQRNPQERSRMEAYISPQYLKTFNKFRPYWKENFRFIDYTRPDCTLKHIDSLFRELDELHKQSGFRAEYMILDWWGLVINQLMLHQLTKSGGEYLRLFRQQTLKAVQANCIERGIHLIVFHQASGQAAARGPAARPTSHDAQEDKNFNNMFTYGFASGTKDDNGNILMVADKARNCARSKVRLHIDGQRCRLVPISDDEDTDTYAEPVEVETEF
jgi:hypothetical protein